MSAGAAADALQRKIFSRYVNQKLSVTRGINVVDVVEEGKTGVLLFNLIEVLSENLFAEKYNQAPKMRVHSLDNCNRALKFAKDQGVVMKVFPQAENLVDGDEKACLGLIWSIILKFMKFGDADESLNAKDALLLWVQNKTSGYKGVDVKDFKSSMKDGVALGAVIHKHRPTMINFDELQPGAANAAANWKIVQAAAERYFGLEAYITPEEIARLDENCMVIYVADFYYGIAEQRKVDLAARRLHKLIDYTKVNDDLRAQYVERAHSFTTRVHKVRALLNDRTIDNTMEGAKRRIAEFYEYKATDKSAILADQLNIEGLYNSLSMRLTHGKRPAYVPPEGTDLVAMNATVSELEKTEQERKTALHAELNRQIKLLETDRQHKDRSGKLRAYQEDLQAYLQTKEVSHSVAAAQYQVRRLAASDEQRVAIVATTFAKLQETGAYLAAEQYERTNEVQAREQELRSSFEQLAGLSVAKKPVLDDDLSREEFREEVRLQNERHIAEHDKLDAWVNDTAEPYLRKKEHVDSVADANKQLGLLRAYRAEQDSKTKFALADLLSLGQKIASARYDKGLSTYSFGDAPDPAGLDTVQARESSIRGKWETLDQLHAEKQAVLDDDLKRETFREQLYVQESIHNGAFATLNAYSAESRAYLEAREHIDDIPKANTAVSILAAWREGKAQQTASALAGFKSLGAEILSAKYESALSSYTFGSSATDQVHPADIQQRDGTIDGHWSALDQLAAAKQQWLDAELDRELRKEEKRVEFANQASSFSRACLEASQSAETTHFGFTLAEVEAFDAVLSSEDASTLADRQSQHDTAVGTFEAGAALGVTENVYTTATPQSLAADLSALQSSLQQRRARYDAELKHQRYLDGLCREFAQLADPFAADIVSSKNAISNSRDELESQLSQLQARKARSQSEDVQLLQQIEASQAKLDAENVTNNIHTTQTGKDISVQHQQFIVFLERKDAMLVDAIEQAKLRGLTPDQFKEIDDNFAQFDADNDKLLTARELKTCLYSLGEEKGPKEIAAIIEKHGNGSNAIDYNNFREFMIQLFGDSDTKDEILNGFQLINRRPDGVTTVERMALVLSDDDVKYIATTAPSKDDGHDAVAWTEDVFSR